MPVFSAWTSGAAYDYTRYLSVDAWAWEFLRRNKDYADDWSRVAGALAAERISNGASIAIGRREESCFSKWGLIFR